MTFNIILFYFFFSILLLSAIGVIISTHAIFSVFFLILVFCNASFILLLLKVEFLAFALILVYIGAVIVLFLFVIMMLDIKKITKNKNTIYFLLPISLILGSIILIEIIFLLFKDLTYNITNLNENLQYFNYHKYIDDYSNIELFGQILYNYYFIAFILTGMILLVAMIGAIVLTLQQPNTNLKRQLINEQLSRKVKYSYFKIK